MIISDFNYLETISEPPSVVGGYKSIVYQDFLTWLEADPALQGDVAQTQTQLTDATGKVTSEAVAVSGRTDNNTLFAFASATTTEPSFVNSQKFWLY